MGNIALCTLSLVGALVMIVPFFVTSRLRKVRHRLILGLAVNDLIQAMVVLIPSIRIDLGGVLVANSAGCKAGAFIYVSLVVANSLWALAIAISTYSLLLHPLSSVALWLHKPWSTPSIWGLIWLVSFINATIGIALFPVADIGGSCFFSRPGQILLYSNLVLFIPRTFAFVVVILIYVRMFFFFRRDSRTWHPSTTSIEHAVHLSSDEADSRTSSASTSLPSDTRLRRPTEHNESASVNVQFSEKTEHVDRRQLALAPTLSRGTSSTATTTSTSSVLQQQWPRWHRKKSKGQQNTSQTSEAFPRHLNRQPSVASTPQLFITEQSGDNSAKTMERPSPHHDDGPAPPAIMRFEEELVMLESMPLGRAVHRFSGPQPAAGCSSPPLSASTNGISAEKSQSVLNYTANPAYAATSQAGAAQSPEVLHVQLPRAIASTTAASVRREETSSEDGQKGGPLAHQAVVSVVRQVESVQKL